MELAAKAESVHRLIQEAPKSPKKKTVPVTKLTLMSCQPMGKRKSTPQVSKPHSKQSRVQETEVCCSEDEGDPVALENSVQHTLPISSLFPQGEPRLTKPSLGIYGSPVREQPSNQQCYPVKFRLRQ